MAASLGRPSLVVFPLSGGGSTNSEQTPAPHGTHPYDLLGHFEFLGQIQRIPTLSKCRRDAYRIHGLPWAFKRPWLLSPHRGVSRSGGVAGRRVRALLALKRELQTQRG